MFPEMRVSDCPETVAADVRMPDEKTTIRFAPEFLKLCENAGIDKSSFDGDFLASHCLEDVLSFHDLSGQQPLSDEKSLHFIEHEHGKKFVTIHDFLSMFSIPNIPQFHGFLDVYYPNLLFVLFPGGVSSDTSPFHVVIQFIPCVNCWEVDISPLGHHAMWRNFRLVWCK